MGKTKKFVRRGKRNTRRKLKGGVKITKFALYLGILSMMVYFVSAFDLSNILKKTIKAGELAVWNTGPTGHLTSTFEYILREGYTSQELQIIEKNTKNLENAKQFIENLEPPKKLLTPDEIKTLIDTRQKYLGIILESLKEENLKKDYYPKPIVPENRNEIIEYLNNKLGSDVIKELNDTSLKNIAVILRLPGVNNNYETQDLLFGKTLLLKDIPVATNINNTTVKNIPTPTSKPIEVDKNDPLTSLFVPDETPDPIIDISQNETNTTLNVTPTPVPTPVPTPKISTEVKHYIIRPKDTQPNGTNPFNIDNNFWKNQQIVNRNYIVKKGDKYTTVKITGFKGRDEDNKIKNINFRYLEKDGDKVKWGEEKTIGTVGEFYQEHSGNIYDANLNEKIEKGGKRKLRKTKRRNKQ